MTIFLLFLLFFNRVIIFIYNFLGEIYMDFETLLSDYSIKDIYLEHFPSVQHFLAPFQLSFNLNNYIYKIFFSNIENEIFPLYILHEKPIALEEYKCRFCGNGISHRCEALMNFLPEFYFYFSNHPDVRFQLLHGRKR